MLKKGGILILLLAVWHTSFAYRDVPVLTHLGMDEQKDTFGFNLVKEIPRLIYNLLESKKVTLWDSPQKNLKITFDNLKNIERSSKTSFTETRDLFMNEVWSSNRKRTTFTILGFSFISKNDKNQSVSYGFVDMEDVYLSMADSIIPCNANGSWDINYLEALYSRNYHFNVVQFGKDDFKDNLLKAIIIRDKAFSPKKKIVNKIKLPTQKKLVYEVLKSDRSKFFYRDIENFFETYPEFFFNHGGDKVFDPLQHEFTFSINKIEIIEAWDKIDGLKVETPLKVVIYFNNVSLPPIDVDDFTKYGLRVDYRDLATVLKTKGFEYLLKKINHQEIQPAQSGKYIRAFENYFWTQITEYVKYE